MIAEFFNQVAKTLNWEVIKEETSRLLFSATLFQKTVICSITTILKNLPLQAHLYVQRIFTSRQPVSHWLQNITRGNNDP